MLVRMLMRYVRQMGIAQKHVILIGIGRPAMQYAPNVLDNPQMAFYIDGYVGDERTGGLDR